MSTSSPILQSKVNKKLFHSRFSMYPGSITPCGPLSTVITLKCTCGWLRSQNDLSGFNSDGPADSCAICPTALFKYQFIFVTVKK